MAQEQITYRLADTLLCSFTQKALPNRSGGDGPLQLEYPHGHLLLRGAFLGLGHKIVPANPVVLWDIDHLLTPRGALVLFRFHLAGCVPWKGEGSSFLCQVSILKTVAVQRGYTEGQ